MSISASRGSQCLYSSWHIHCIQMGQCFIDSTEVFLYDCFTTFAIGLLDALFDAFNGLFSRQDTADGEETGLHDGINAPTHTYAAGNLVSIDDIKLELFLSNLLLGF